MMNYPDRSPFRHLPLNYLLAFEAVGRHCHVRKAADELCLTHSAVSRQIKNLEQHLDTALFTRNANRLQLTEAGIKLLTTIQACFETMSSGLHSLDPELLAGDLVVAATPSIANNWLLDVIGAYAKRYPEVAVSLVTIAPHSHELPPNFDVAICLASPDADRYQVDALYQENYFPVCSPALIQPGDNIQSARDLLRYPLLHHRLNFWQRWLDPYGLSLDHHHAGIQLDYGFLAIEAARRHMGIALADQVEVAHDLQSGRLIRLLDQVLSVDDDIYLATPKTETNTRRTRLFVETLNSCLLNKGVRRLSD